MFNMDILKKQKAKKKKKTRKKKTKKKNKEQKDMESLIYTHKVQGCVIKHIILSRVSHKMM